MDSRTPRVVEVLNGTFSKDINLARYVLLHETGHVIDIMLGFSLSRSHASATGATLDNPDCIGNLNAFCGFAPASGAFSYYSFFSGRPEEDFAETWAAMTFGGDWNALLENNGSLIFNPTVPGLAPGGSPSQQQWFGEWIKFLQLNAQYS